MAIYQASWMARNMHSIKMFIFAEQLEYDEETVLKLKCLNHFLELFYIPLQMSFSCMPLRSQMTLDERNLCSLLLI